MLWSTGLAHQGFPELLLWCQPAVQTRRYGGNPVNPDTLSATLQKGFHVTLGATAALLEAIQNPQNSSQRFSELGNDVHRIAEELEAKGETTEREARQLVDRLLSQVPNPFPSPGPASPTPTVDAVATPIADSAVQSDLAALTQELSEIRQAIEDLKRQTQ